MAAEAKGGEAKVGKGCGCRRAGDLIEGALLLIAHPGHELRLHAWLGLARPTVAVLTDGSGRSGQSRLDETAATLNLQGARPARLFGALRDVDLYALLLARDAEAAWTLVQDLAEQIVTDRPAALVCDAAEGLNPGHDLCRALGGLVARLARQRGWAGQFMEFPLEGPPLRPELETMLRVDLCEACFAAKRQRSRVCADLLPDVDAVEQNTGIDAFRHEALYAARLGRHAGADADGLPPHGVKPFYERWGEARVTAHKYINVVRRAEHMLPLLEDLEAKLDQALEATPA